MARGDLIEVLGGVALFSRCTRRDLKTIARHAETVTVAEGTSFITEGDPGDAFYVILAGAATVSRDGKELNRVTTGAYFGELALLDDEPRSATVVASTTTSVAVLGVRMFRTLLREYPDLSQQLLAGLAGELRRARVS